jgi:cyclic pyranopterin phosphate synthase
MMTDRYGRIVDYVRIAVTSACNLRCTYCMREDAPEEPLSTTRLDAGQLRFLLEVLADMGVRKIRFTGGEPLLRNDIVELVRIAKETPGIGDVKLTTNGVLLEKHLGGLMAAGLDGINLSLDTLDPVRYAAIARRGVYHRVRSSLDALLALPAFRLKINTLLLRGVNDDEIGEFAELTRNHDITIRFMELQPFDDRQIWRTGRFMGAEMISERLRATFPSIRELTGAGTEHYSFRIPGYRGSIAIIPAYSRNFCNRCSRLRITADGKLISCLYNQERIDLLPILQKGKDKTELRNMILAAVSTKPENGLKSREGNAETSMSRIGG